MHVHCLVPEIRAERIHRRRPRPGNRVPFEYVSSSAPASSHARCQRGRRFEDQDTNSRADVGLGPTQTRPTLPSLNSSLRPPISSTAISLQFPLLTRPCRDYSVPMYLAVAERALGVPSHFDIVTCPLSELGGSSVCGRVSSSW